jgi:hypothetical protein
MTIAHNLDLIRKSLPGHVKLVAVSKTIPPAGILEAYEAGQRLFGENKAQEIRDKQPLLPADIQWHFVGHLQTNKVKYIAPYVDTIHSVDSLKLLGEIDRQAARNGRVIRCLLQFHIATEETKFGLDLREAEEILQSPELTLMKNVLIAGVMGMATLSDDHFLIRKEFSVLRSFFEKLKAGYFPGQPFFREISMGMTNDFRIAVEEGSTMVRVGTAIFF